MDPEQFQALIDMLDKLKFGQLWLVFMVSFIWAKTVADIWRNR